MPPENNLQEEYKKVHIQITASLLSTLETAERALAKISDAVLITNFENSQDIKKFHSYVHNFNKGMTKIEESISKIGEAYGLEL